MKIRQGSENRMETFVEKGRRMRQQHVIVLHTSHTVRIILKTDRVARKMALLNHGIEEASPSDGRSVV